MSLLWKRQVDTDVYVQPLGRDEFEYREGGRRLRVVAELLGKRPPDRMFYLSSIRQWLPPHESEPVDDETRGRIVTNMRRFFTLNDIEVAEQ